MRIYEVPIAHRGLHDEEATENSIAAFKKAIEAGYNIETDVRLSKDGKIIVFHDYDMGRLLHKSGAIEGLTYAELTNGNYKLSNGENVPLFEDLLKLADGKVEILCELKSRNFYNFRLEEAVYQMIKDKPWVKIQSFNPLSVEWFRKNAPEVMRGQLATAAHNRAMKIMYRFVGPFVMLKKTKPQFLAFDVKYLPSDFVKDIVEKEKLKLITWTVRTKTDIENAKKMNADNIIFENFIPENI
jgi:Glycerophosphoryl diester phosphodiesterase